LTRASQFLLCVTICNGVAVAAPADDAPTPTKVAILLFDGVEIIDYTGPYEVFGAGNGFEIYTVSATEAAITTAMGMRVLPKYTFANAPQADVVIIPGGDVRTVQNDAPTLEWLKKQSGAAEHVMSVCNGAFTLANTGLLQGLTSTTTRAHIDTLKRQHPQIKVVRDQRVVDNGKFLTTGGLSAGIDGALHILSRMRGEGEAHAVAVQLEYDWRPEGSFLPGTDAIHVLPSVGGRLSKVVHGARILSTQGDKDRWTLVVELSSDLAGTRLLEEIGKAYADAGKWSRSDSRAPPADHPVSAWNAIDGDGRRWTVTIASDEMAGQPNRHLVKFAVVAAG